MPVSQYFGHFTFDKHWLKARNKLDSGDQNPRLFSAEEGPSYHATGSDSICLFSFSPCFLSLLHLQEATFVQWPSCNRRAGECI